MKWDLSGGAGQSQEHAAHSHYSQSVRSGHSSVSSPHRPNIQQREIAHESFYQSSPRPVQDRALVTSDSQHSHHNDSSRSIRHHRSAHSGQQQSRNAPVSYQPSSQPAVHHRFPHFQYSSKCTGRKKALCIGINYYGQQSELHGCVNDAKEIMEFLIKHYNYKEHDIVLLTDDSRDPRSQPTMANIRAGMRWLVDGARTHDSLFFHYSGHGGQVKDRNGDEIDGYDEVIYPVDFKTQNVLVDDEMHNLMVHPLPIGCRLTAVFDSCHSGSALDLPYLYHADGRVKGSQVTADHLAEKSTPADVISLSGCTDSQTSADTTNAAGVAIGAMSQAFITCLQKNPTASYQELLEDIRAILRKHYSQKPQLSSSHPIDTTLKFIM